MKTTLSMRAARLMLGATLAACAMLAPVAATAAPVTPSSQAPDFTLRGMDGQNLRLQELRGRVVLVNFWATWCGPCRLEMPSIQKLHREFKTRGLVVLGINQGEDVLKVRPFLKKNGYDFGILLDAQQSVAGRYQVSSIPSLFIIDRTGTIRSHFVGVRDEDTLREALAKAGMP